MTYQIPQQLQYKEKIMFGLTFKQLAYAFIFGLLALINFKIVKMLEVGFVFVFFWAVLGICFMFFDFDSKIRDYWFFLKKRRLCYNKNNYLATFGIREISDDVIITNKNRKISIIKINPINFSIKNPDEKDTIVASFQKFLNSLDFPTQIVMNTESLNLDKYLNSLQKRVAGEKHREIYEDYKSFLESTIKSKNLMNRGFYLVIKEQTDITIQTNVCLDRFHALNLKVHRLKTFELKEFMDKFFFNLNDEEIELTNNVNHLKIDKKYVRIIYASGYPRNVEPGFLDRIVSLPGDFNLSLHIKPYPIENMLVNLNKELQKQRGDLFSMQSKGVINPSLEIQYNDTRSALESLQKGQERLFNISLYITCKADKLEDLNSLTKKVESELNSIMIIPKNPNYRVLQGFYSTLPLGNDELSFDRNIPTTALSAFFPFTSQFLQADETGVWMGLNNNNIPIIKDIFKLSNPNGVVLAQSGGGKSFFCKLLITRYLLNGTKVIIVDPQGEYKSLVSQFGGQIIDLSRKSETLINALDLMGHDYTEKRLSLMDLMPIMLGNISEPQKAFLDKAITDTYNEKGITLNPDSWNVENHPILSDLLANLQKQMRRATQVEKATLRSVINRLDMYVSGVFGFMNRQTNIKFNNNLICFDIGNMPKQVKPMMMYLVLDYVYMKMRSDIERKILLVDEAWSLLSRAEEASYIFEIVKTCRKFNMGLLLINQEVEDLFNSRAGKSVLANSAYTMLLKQKPSVIKSISDAFHLSPIERDHLLTANVGEGLLIMEDEHSKIRVVASEKEAEVITTNPDELLAQEVEKRNSGQKNINVDLDKRFYKRKDLNEDEIKYLISQGYKEFSQKSIVSGKKEDYILNPRHNESLNHMFVIYDIAEYLKKKGIDSQLYTTKMPDVVFNHNGKSYAIEVETGSVLTNMKKFKEKLKLLDDNYKDNWYFLVTDKNLVGKYRKFGHTIDPRCIDGFFNKLLKNS
jgi:type IV secretory pathway VirB4 component